MEPNKTVVNIPMQEMRGYFTRILQQLGFEERKAAQCAEIFTSNSVDGVYTHGVNRFPRFAKYVRDGIVHPDAEPVLTSALGALEQWDGNLGPGILNAMHATNRAMQLAADHGIGCVALANTNHWMRAGAYGWQAAKAGFVFIGWTNTIANMPAWGAMDAKLGNNPLVLAVPFEEEAIVLDMAMSQYSLGAIENALIKKEKMGINAGFDTEGKLSDDPSEILATRRLLPVGYWKGAGLALLLDILSTILSGGRSTQEISREKYEARLSQVFVAIDIKRLPNHSTMVQVVKDIIEDLQRSVPADEQQRISFPGERVLATRKHNIIHGIPVQQKIWDIITRLQTDQSVLDELPYN
jgi:3-dehydro-L-gulonate 2-dehydrogenase